MVPILMTDNPVDEYDWQLEELQLNIFFVNYLT